MSLNDLIEVQGKKFIYDNNSQKRRGSSSIVINSGNTELIEAIVRYFGALILLPQEKHKNYQIITESLVSLQ